MAEIEIKLNKATTREVAVAQLLAGEKVSPAQLAAAQKMQAEAIRDKATKQKERASKALATAEYLEGVSTKLEGKIQQAKAEAAK